MSHDTHQEHSKENKTIISFKNSFWLVVILILLFVGALNFIQAESGGEEGKGEVKEKTEMKAGTESPAEKAGSKPQDTMPAEAKPAEAAGKDSATKDVE